MTKEDADKIPHHERHYHEWNADVIPFANHHAGLLAGLPQGQEGACRLQLAQTGRKIHLAPALCRSIGLRRI